MPAVVVNGRVGFVYAEAAATFPLDGYGFFPFHQRVRGGAVFSVSEHVSIGVVGGRAWWRSAYSGPEPAWNVGAMAEWSRWLHPKTRFFVRVHAGADRWDEGTTWSEEWRPSVQLAGGIAFTTRAAAPSETSAVP